MHFHLHHFSFHLDFYGLNLYTRGNRTVILNSSITDLCNNSCVVLDAGQVLTDQVKGVELMRKLGIKSNERKIVENLVDFNLNKDKIYEAMKEQAVLFLKTGKREDTKDVKTVNNDTKKTITNQHAKQQGIQLQVAQNVVNRQQFKQGAARGTNNQQFNNNQRQFPHGTVGSHVHPDFQAQLNPNFHGPFNPYQQANFNQHFQGQQHGFQYPGTFQQPGSYRPHVADNRGPHTNKTANQQSGKQGGPQAGNVMQGPKNGGNQRGNKGGKGTANENKGNQNRDDKSNGGKGGPSKNGKKPGKGAAPDQGNAAVEVKDSDGQQSTIVVHVHNVSK